MPEPAPNVDLRPPPGKTPLYVRLAETIRERVATGVLQPGDRLPAIRQLAKKLHVHSNTVARTYAELEREGVLSTRRGGGTFVAAPSNDPVLAALREERLRSILSKAVLEAMSLGYGPAQIEHAMTHHVRGNSRASGAANQSQMADPLIIVGSDDLALDLLIHRLRRHAASVRPVLSAHAGSFGGLLAVCRGEAHLAGIHLWDAERAVYNTPFVERMSPGRPMVIVNLTQRQQGLMVRPGNPKKIRGLRDLAKKGVVFVNRQAGSGTRLLLESELKRLGVEPADVQGYDHEVNDHTSVAERVANDAADVGVGTLAAARTLRLEFLPIRYERYDLVIPEEIYDSELMRPLLETLASHTYKGAVENLGGYDTSLTGTVIARWRPKGERRAGGIRRSPNSRSGGKRRR